MVGLDGSHRGLLGVAASPARAAGDAGDRRTDAGRLAAVRGRIGLVTLLAGAAGACWWWTVRRTAGMDGGPGTDPGTFAWFVGVWVVMMAAMMLPSVSPTVALYARMTRRRGPGRPLLFAAAYLLVWTGVGAVVYGLVEAGRALLAGRLEWDQGGRWVAGGVLLLAAAYEVTPLKDMCLAKCRSPLGFLLGSWREGRTGALRMGARHAAWCLGCCWALMAALVALGAMSVVWMAVVAAMITAEKTLPWRRAALAVTTAVLVALAVGVVMVPRHLPGLALPGGGQTGVPQMGGMPR